MANWSKLSKAWTKDFLSSEVSAARIAPAIERALPLLQDPSAVPFVCRYRTDVIQPLSTKQIHRLSDHIQKYNALGNLREKILPILLQEDKLKSMTNKTKKSNNSDLIFRVETSISKSELDDIYAPFKPPSKGSLEDRIRKEHPDLIPAVDELWDTGNTKPGLKLIPRDAAITLLANRIANHLPVMDSAMDYCTKYCRIRVKQAPGASSSSGTKGKGKGKTAAAASRTRTNKEDGSKADKYKAYFDFNCKFHYLKDHQVLAIRRGTDQKILKHTLEIDNDRAESIIANMLAGRAGSGLYRDAIHDAWTRLIRKRVTSRLWKQHCGFAEERAIDVFCDNLHKALLAPPAMPSRAILVLDPGFQAGIKCAILDPIGQVESLQTVKFLGSAREEGKLQLLNLLQSTESLDVNVTDEKNIRVIVGNGHGMREARELVNEVATDENIPIAIEVVNEAGASVWSVTEMASDEFPTQSAAAVAAVSIGRRYQNPLNELVKIPPKSLGLGMYQHDLSEKDLDDKLTATSSNAVAEVGVDINGCSVEILEKVPSITKALCKKIVKARPLQSRNQLLDVPGIGPKTFESCAAFVRIHEGVEPLDGTLVHPESYDLARWLMKKLKFEFGNPKSVSVSVSKISSKVAMKTEWSDVAKKAAKRFGYTEDRVFAVIEHLLFSITRPDPRLSSGQHEENKIGSPKNCTALPSHIATTEALRKACPVRGVTATIRNVVDFGAFVDFGGENDGLLHRTKLGSVSLASFLVGQEIGIDILGVSKFEKVSVGLTGLDLPVENLDAKRPMKGGSRKADEVKRRRRR